MTKKVSSIYIFFPLIVGAITGFISMPGMNYSSMAKPLFSPPGILFPIVWSILYLLLGISYFLLKQENDVEKESIIYYFQLFINYLWPIIFFVFHWYFFAVLWIFLLDVTVIYMLYLFYQKNKLSCFLNIPYLLWILFATYLTIGVYLLN